MLGLKRSPWRDLSDIHPGKSFHAIEVDETPLASQPGPMRHLQLPNIFHPITVNDRQPCTLNPLSVGCLLVAGNQFFFSAIVRHSLSPLRRSIPVIYRLNSFPLSHLVNVNCECLARTNRWTALGPSLFPSLDDRSGRRWRRIEFPARRPHP
jgi:hypothetical protein